MSSAQTTGVLANMSALNGSSSSITGTSLLKPEEGCATDRPLDRYQSRRKGSTSEPERNMDVRVCPCTRERNPGSGFHAKGTLIYRYLYEKNTPYLSQTALLRRGVLASTYRDDRLCVWARLKTLGIKSTSNSVPVSSAC